MGEEAIDSIVSIVVAIIGLAILSVLFGSKNTAGVISAATKGFASDLSALTSPISGGSSPGGFNTSPSPFGSMNLTNFGMSGVIS